jgi:signal transduction histidine kinase
VILAQFALFAVWIDPTKPAGYIEMTYCLLVGYLCYSAVLALAVWNRELARTRSAVAIHSFDLLIFAVFMFLTTAPPSPFFAFFVFSLVSATLRWQWRGTIYTTAVALGIEIAMAAYPADLPRGPEFEINHLIFRIGYLLVVAILLGYLGAYEQQQRGKISSLAAWPRTIPEEIYPLVSEILQRAASVLAAPRTLLLWKDEEEPLLYAASWSWDQFNHSIESPDTFGSLVAEPLADENFLCRDTLAPKPFVLHGATTGFERWHGMPLHPELQNRFSIKSVLSFVLQSENVSGRLFALDKEYMTSDDLILGRIVSHEASCNLDQFYQQKRRKQTSAVEERGRLARDLHDGVLQSLTVAVLQLDFAQQLLEKDPQNSRQRLLDVKKLISTEQENLRSHIRQLKPPYSSLPEWDGDLPQRLKELAERIERQWGPHVSIDESLHLSPLPWTMAQEVYFIIQEALINAARHANASSIRTEVNSTDHQLQIIVSDNGHGFSFTGRHDQAMLTEKNLGPIILRERIASIGGRLAIESGKAGARLEITLPINK